MPLSEWLGGLAGAALSPLTGATSALRRSRMFHPRGLVCKADVAPMPADASLRELADALAGPALVRWSSAWWKRGELPDVLGCALRFSRLPLCEAAREGDQDLAYNGPLRRPDTRGFRSVAQLTLESWLDLDQEALRFAPFRNGRGLVPVGFVQALRRSSYASSQALRPKHR